MPWNLGIDRLRLVRACIEGLSCQRPLLLWSRDELVNQNVRLGRHDVDRGHHSLHQKLSSARGNTLGEIL